MSKKSQRGSSIPLDLAMELFRQTPKEVWREYFDNGYTLGSAIREEFGYGEGLTKCEKGDQ